MIKVYHKDGCGELCFQYDQVSELGEPKNVYYNGMIPDPVSLCKCESCGAVIKDGELVSINGRDAVISRKH